MRALVLVGLLTLLVACGDDDDGPVDSAMPVDTGGGEMDAGTDAGDPDTGPPDTGPEDAGPADTGPADTGPADTGPVDTGPPDTGPVDAGPMCLEPMDLQGDYTTSLEGTCDDYIDFATQTVDPTVGGGACDITFTSLEAKGSLGVNGTVTIDENGGFSGELQVNMTTVMCDGEWDSTMSRLTLTCGDCTITLDQNLAG